MRTLFILLIGFISLNAYGQETKFKTVKIQTSAKCGACEKKIENALNYLKGVSYAELNNTTKVVTVKYRRDKVNLAKIKQTLSETGYDADDVKAKKEAVAKLPACCKPHNKAH